MGRMRIMGRMGMVIEVGLHGLEAAAFGNVGRPAAVKK
jgi:hypothetical protein